MRHTKATREAVVAMIRVNTRPLLELAREFEVSTNTLRAWLRESNLRQRSQEEARRIATTLNTSHTETLASGQALAQRDRLLMHALEHSPATIIITDSDGRIVYANPKFVETTGYAISEVIGQNPRVLKSGITASADYRKLWKTILSGKSWRGNFRNRRKDGSLYWERASISPVFGGEGKITHFMAVKEDITELMEAELASRRSVSMFKSMFTALPFPVMLVDSGGFLQYANQAAELLCGIALTAGNHFAQLNLRWVDAEGHALGSDHPLVRLLAGDEITEDNWTRLGIISPIGGVRWVEAFLQRLLLPETRDHAALLVITPAEAA
jgi:PAS domain S-box-containing protein